MAFQVGVRASPEGVWLPLVERGEYAANRTRRFSVCSAGYTATALRIAYRDGYFTRCDTAEPDPSSPWDGCASVQGGFSMNVSLQGPALLSSPSEAELPARCTVAGDAGGAAPVTCRGFDVGISPAHMVAVSPVSAATLVSEGSVAFDVSAFTPHTCEPPTLSWGQDAASLACSDPEGWVKLVDDASFAAAGPTSSFAPSLPTAGVAYILQEIRVVYESGYVGCDSTAAPERGWGGCLHTMAGTSSNTIAFEFGINGEWLVTQDSAFGWPTYNDQPCVLPAPSHGFTGDFTCPLGVSITSSDALEFGWYEARLNDDVANNAGTITFDVWGRITPTAAISGTISDSVPSARPGGTWVSLLSDVGYRAGPAGHRNPQYRPDLHGAEHLHVTKIKAVHRSGFVTLDTSHTQNTEQWPWNAAALDYSGFDQPGPLLTPSSFALLKNGVERVLFPDSFSQPPSSCTEVPQDLNGNGQFVCGVDFWLRRGDTLTPTEFELETGTDVDNNDGEHFIDVWGYVDNVAALDAATASDAGAITAGTTCSSACEAGLVAVGSMTRTCTANGQWTADELRCVGTLAIGGGGAGVYLLVAVMNCACVYVLGCV